MIKTLLYIWNHPFNSKNRLAGISRFFKWQINCFLNKYDIIYQLSENSKIVAKKGLTGVTGNIYNGLHEFNDKLFLLHFLRENDTFCDIGANVGVYTILASAEVGSKTISIEPIPSTFDLLKFNILINQINDKVILLNIGLGAVDSEIAFTKNLDTANHVATSIEIANKNIIKIPIKTLDEVTKNNTPLILKIDVEGYETEVLNGANNLLKNPILKAIIIELNGAGQRYGYDENLIHCKLLLNGFKIFSYNPYSRELVNINYLSKQNTLYIRDYDFVKERIINSRKIKIQKQLI
jgi:FkbM family methyltransferase